MIGFSAGTGAVVAVNAASAGIISTLGFSTEGELLQDRLLQELKLELDQWQLDQYLLDCNLWELWDWEYLEQLYFQRQLGLELFSVQFHSLKNGGQRSDQRAQRCFQEMNDEILFMFFLFLSMKVKIESTNTKIKALILILLVGGLFGCMAVWGNVLGFLEWRVGQLLVGLLARLWDICGLI